MRRRAALAAAGALALGRAGDLRALGGPPAASAAPALGMLAWGPAGCWVGAPGGSLQRLPGDAAPGIAPTALGGSVWRVASDGAVERWQRGGGREAEPDGAWRLAWRRALAQPARAFAVAEAGRVVAAAHSEQLSLLDADGELLKRFEGRDASGTRLGAAQAVFALARRRSLAVAWPTLGEVWEIALDPQAPPVFEGWVHDYRMGEGLASRGHLGLRRSPLGLPLPRLGFAEARMPWLAGTLDDGVVVVHLDVRRRIATLPVADARLESALLRRTDPRGEGAAAGPRLWWLPAGDTVQLVDTARWQLRQRLRLPGPVLALQELGGRVWALVESPVGGRLHAQHDGEWRAFGPAGEVRALAADERGEHALLATRRPSALWLLDAAGAVIERRPLPEAAEVEGVAIWRG